MRQESLAKSIVVTLFAVLTTMPAAAGTGAAPVPEERRISERFDTDGITSFSFEMGVGELEIQGGSGDTIEVAVRVDCNRDGWGSRSCSDRAERVRLESRTRDGRLELSLEGTGAWRNRGMEVEVVVSAPAHLAASVDMGIGELTVENMIGDTSLELGIGEVSVRSTEEAFHSATLDVGTGEASLRGRDAGRHERAGLFVRALSWDEGRGEARLRVDLGIGEISVRLN